MLNYLRYKKMLILIKYQNKIEELQKQINNNGKRIDSINESILKKNQHDQVKTTALRWFKALSKNRNDWARKRESVHKLNNCLSKIIKSNTFNWVKHYSQLKYKDQLQK